MDTEVAASTVQIFVKHRSGARCPRRGSVERRIESKKREGEKKRDRGWGV